MVRSRRRLQTRRSNNTRHEFANSGMKCRFLHARPLSREACEPFGDVLDQLWTSLKWEVHSREANACASIATLQEQALGLASNLAAAEASLSERETQNDALANDLKVEKATVRSILQEHGLVLEELRETKVRLEAVQSGSGRRSQGLTDVEWQFSVGEDDWTGMPPDISASMYSRYKIYRSGGEASFRIKSGVEEYDVDLSTMEQTNVRTKNTRSLRCRLGVPSYWTACVDIDGIQGLCKQQTIELSGFPDVGGEPDKNGVYVLSSLHSVNSQHAWLRADGSGFIYSDKKYGGWRFAYSKHFHTVFNDCETVGKAYCETSPDSSQMWRVHGLGNNPDIDAVVSVSRPIARARSFVDIAVEIFDAEIRQKIERILVSSISHELQHAGSSCCTNLKARLKITRVIRIEHWHLWIKYCSHLRLMRADMSKHRAVAGPIEGSLVHAVTSYPELLGDLDSSVGEMFLFHGTALDVATQIAMEGFDFRLSKRDAGYYGHGTYFATQLCKSHQYATPTVSAFSPPIRTIILSRVAVGDMWRADTVDRQMRRPPMRPGTSRRCDSVLAMPGPMPGHFYGVQSHQEVVIFEMAQAYPQFIIQYTCGDPTDS